MIKPYLVFMDVDGTLSYDHLHVSDLTSATIRKWQAKGVIFYIASGRPRMLAEPIAQQIDEQVHLVASNGAVYQDNKGQWIINFLTANDIMQAYQQIAQNGLNAFFFGLNDLYYTRQLPQSVMKYGKEYFIETAVYPIEPHYVEKLSDLNGALHDRITNGIILFDDESVMKQVKAQLSQTTNMHLSASSKHNIEMIPHDVDKSTAIAALQAVYQTDTAHTLVFGDGPNDIGMMQQADISVAMGNALPDVKQAAHYVTDSNVDDGIAHFLDKFFADKF